MDTFFVLFPKAVAVARPTNDQQSERPVFFFCTVGYLLHMICRYQQAGEWTRKQVEMGSCGILDMCSLQEYSRRGGEREGTNALLDEQRAMNNYAGQAKQGSRERGKEMRANSLFGSASALEGRNRFGSRQSGHPSRERYSTKMSVRSTHWSIHGRGRRPPPKWPLAPAGPPSFPPHAALTIAVETLHCLHRLGQRSIILSIYLITSGTHWHSRPPVDLQVRYRVVSATANTGMLGRH